MINALADGRDTIEPPHFWAAWHVIKAAEKSVTRIFAHRTGNGLADRIGCLFRKAPEQQLTRTEVNDALKGHKAAWMIDDAIELLQTYRLVEEYQVPTGGRPVTSYRWTGPA